MFKKSLSVILALLMVISCMCTMIFTASANDTPEGTPITSLSQITDLTGDYYLNADIGSAKNPSSTTVSGNFTGTLDGNGKTIYTSSMIFERLSFGATVKNLTIEGKVTLNNQHGGVLAKFASLNTAGVQDAVTLQNVTNNANIVASSGGGWAVGGFIGFLYGAINIIDCENNGTVSTPTGTSHYVVAGGFIGKADNEKMTNPQIVFEKCKNNGNVTIETSNNFIYMGGFIGQNAMSGAEHTFVSCENNGTLTATLPANAACNVGGIVGRTQEGNYTFVNCKNSKAIDVTADSSTSLYVGGMAGYANQTIKAYRCTNDGNITASANAVGVAGIAATSGDTSTFVFVKNNGTITSGTTNTYDVAPNATNAYAPGETDVSFAAVQRSAEVTDGEYALRFVSEITNIGEYASTGVVVYYMKDGETVKYTNKYTETVYTQIGASSTGVNEMFPTTATAGKFYSALTVTNIPVTGTYEFIVVPYTIDMDGEYVYANAYTVTVTDGEVAAPTAFN